MEVLRQEVEQMKRDAVTARNRSLERERKSHEKMQMNDLYSNPMG
jgi:hypothetical protein